MDSQNNESAEDNESALKDEAEASNSVMNPDIVGLRRSTRKRIESTRLEGYKRSVMVV
ncbi:hypothetical protein TSUD_115480 [Trifolium subterraneum]|uniref:Uncharacterized protein n=1 Tax=Trifolium subterraneum TaxID=3900 RepID=A0A2Z6MAH6_TRISU|nr:hypothetical protein TSUD_115480 [Trifolium subterraneum]